MPEAMETFTEWGVRRGKWKGSAAVSPRPTRADAEATVAGIRERNDTSTWAHPPEVVSRVITRTAWTEVEDTDA